MKILVGYRGVDVGKDLLEIALMHAKAFNGEVLVVTSMMGGERTEQPRIEDAEKNLKDAKQYFDENGITAHSHLLVRGVEAGEDIIDFAKEKQVDEIIIGVKSRSKVGKLLFGSTAQAIILRAPCPVVTVR
ncbi:UspA3 [Desulforapulum autotrophicum HRM2]|uniref:UspA3 n=1 Tax=Desulforapulum autotrophicum (strain ATCC 43914 / DSM 3382 / VKM B-1955 / HRM2) TaxID=177437 RepID=C0QAV6_DESAH|nr:universal stress protein [Desulforapulum autotrophicum]ACN16889.1 UspA3 [Desulforapulum autotrophicum HRM2]